MKEFDIHLYKYVYNKPSEIGLYSHMSKNLEVMIGMSEGSEVAKLSLFRSPTNVARMEFQKAIEAGMDAGQALYTAVGAYEERRDDFVIRSANDEVLYQCDQKRARGIRLSKKELDAELRAFMDKRGE